MDTFNGKKLIVDGAHKTVINKLERDIEHKADPKTGKIADKKRPALEDYRKHSDAYDKMWRNGYAEKPEKRVLHEMADKYDKPHMYDKAHDDMDELEAVHRRVTAAAAHEHRSMKEHEQAHWGTGKKK